MKVFIKKYEIIFISFLVITNLIFTVSCKNSADSANANSNQSSANNTNSENTNSAKDDVAELGTRVRLAALPEEAVWHEEPFGKTGSRAPGSNEKKLTAVMKFTPENANLIAAQAAKIKPAEKAEIGTESWFPEELTAQSQLSGDETLKGTAYAANDFYNAPYVNGKLTRVENTDYFVLELTSF